MYGAPYPHPSAPPPPPPKKGPSGCLIAGIVAAALGVVALIVVVVIVVKVRSVFTPEERAALEAEIRESATAGARPGSQAVRGVGCFGVDIVDVATMPALKRHFTDAGPNDVLVEKVIVDCRPDVRVEPPTCERVAKAYLGEVGRAPGPFRVMVHKVPQEPLCNELRAADGTPMR